MKTLLFLCLFFSAAAAADLTLLWDHDPTAAFLTDTNANEAALNPATGFHIYKIEGADPTQVPVETFYILADTNCFGSLTNRKTGVVLTNTFHFTFTNITPGVYTFYAIAENIWGKKSLTSDSATTPPDESPGNPDLKRVIVNIP